MERAIIFFMKAYIEGNLRICENASFKDAKTGEKVPYYVFYIQDEDGQLSKIGCRDDHSDLVGRDAVFTVTVKPDFNKPNLFRLSVIDVKPS